MSTTDLQIPKWFWGILAIMMTAILGAMLSWMGWVSIQVVNQSSTMAKIEAQLIDIKAGQILAATTAKDAQVVSQDTAVKVARLEERVNAVVLELKVLQEKFNGDTK